MFKRLEVAAKAALARDPGNIKAKTVERVVERQRTEAKQVAQVRFLRPLRAPSNELNLRPAGYGGRPTPLPPPAAQAADNPCRPRSLVR